MKKIILLYILATLTVACTNDKRENDGNFTWDFSEEGKEYVYDFEQTVENRMSYGETKQNSPVNDERMKANGKLHIAVKKNNMADMIIKFTNWIILSDSNNKQSSGNKELKIKYITERGEMDDLDQEMLLYAIFPLPFDSIGIGEKSIIKCHIPVRLQSEVIYSEGKIVLILEKFENIDGNKCAVFKSKIDINDEGKKDKSEYKVSVTGTGIHKFDIERGCYVECETDLDMDMYFKFDMGEELTLGGASEMSMTNKNHFVIKLEDINN